MLSLDEVIRQVRMPQLYFKVGPVTSRKSLELLCIRDTYHRQNKKVLVIKPFIDTRDGADIIRSRSGLSCVIDAIIQTPEDIKKLDVTGVSCILSDESQFYSASIVEELWHLSDRVPIMAFGLLGDFQTNLFEGSKRLIELAAKIEFIKTTCLCCNRKANFNLRISNGRAVYEGNQIELGGEESYAAVCRQHYLNFELPNQPTEMTESETPKSQAVLKTHSA
jgi:thymidine kinase